MNSIRQTQALNKRELEAAIPPSASWHVDYRDTAYIYIGGLPFDVSEGDIVTIFSQFGNPTHVNLIRDKDTGKSKGFAFLKYEDQRSCDLAVDNLGGAEVLGRLLRVDHARYKRRDDEDEDNYRVDGKEGEGNGSRERGSGAEDAEEEVKRKKAKTSRAKIKEEIELEELLRIKEGEEEDPMRDYLIREKKEEVKRALARVEKEERKHRHRHRDRDHNNDPSRSHRHRNGKTESEKRHSRHGHKYDDMEDRPERNHRRRSSSGKRSRSKSRDDLRRGDRYQDERR